MQKLRVGVIPILFLLCLFIGLGVILFAAYAHPRQSIAINDEQISFFDSGWSYKTESGFVPVNRLPAKLPDGGGELVLRNRLPSQYVSGMTLCLKTIHQTLSVSVEGKLIYEYGTGKDMPPAGKMGTAWNFVRLPENTAGKEILLHIESPYPLYSSFISAITLGSKSANVFYVFGKSFSGIAFCVFALIIGFLLIAAALLLRRHFPNSGLFYLGAFSLLVGLWILTDCNALQFFDDSRVAGLLLSFFSFSLMPVPFLLFVQVACKIHRKYIYNLLCGLFLGLFVINIALQMLGWADLIQTVIFTHALIFLALLTALATSLEEVFRYRNRDARLMVAAMAALCVFVTADFIRFYQMPYQDNSFFFRIGLVIFLGTFSVKAVTKAIRLMARNMEARVLERLAYTDALTKLGNRTAFDRDMLRTSDSLKSYRSVSVAVFDLNCLKKTNDTYGHTAGDNLIKGAAACLQEAFQRLGSCYRIGGDEFVVLMKNRSVVSIENCFLDFQERIKQYNVNHFHRLDIAAGFATGEAAQDTLSDVQELFSNADANMYRDKAHSKEDVAKSDEGTKKAGEAEFISTEAETDTNSPAVGQKV